MIKFSTFGMAIVCILAISACGSRDMQDLESFIRDTKADSVGKVEPLPTLQSFEQYAYQGQDARDPFRPSIASVRTVPNSMLNGSSISGARSAGELEHYSLESLSMVGIVNNKGQRWAIIKAPDGNIFRVREGNFMGKNHGKITKITDEMLEINEIVTTSDNRWTERINRMELNQ